MVLGLPSEVAIVWRKEQQENKRDVECVDERRGTIGSAELLPHNLGRIIEYRSNIFGFKSLEESYNQQ